MGGHFHHVVDQCAVDLFEPMGHAIWHNDDVTFAYPPGLASFDFLAPYLVGPDAFRIKSCPPSDEGCDSFQYVNHVRITRVNLCNARGVATARVDLERAGFKQLATLAECRGDSTPFDERGSRARLVPLLCANSGGKRESDSGPGK